MSYVTMTGEQLYKSCKKTIDWCNEQLRLLDIEYTKELVEAEMNRRNWWRKLFFMKPLTYAEVYQYKDKLPRSHIDGHGDSYFLKTIPYQMYQITASSLLPLCKVNGVFAPQVSVSSKDKAYLLDSGT